MTRRQREAIRDLVIALERSALCGLFELLPDTLQPCVNQFCDAINELEKHEYDQ